MSVRSRLRAWRPRLIILLGLALAVLPAVSVFWQSGTVPRTNDLLPHLYRVVALREVWGLDALWPRWSPDLVHGFGYPVFNFFPALSHMGVGLLDAVGLPLTLSYRLMVFLHAWLAAIGAFWFGRALSNRSGGWLAAIAYVYSPYLLYDAGVRGSLPESQALALLPFVALALWGALRRQTRWVVALPFLFAGMFLSHFPVTFQAGLILGLWTLWSARRLGWSSLVGPLLGTALGVGLTAFFWLPALMEIGSTRADLSISQGYGLADNFLSLADLVSLPSLPVDSALINPPVVRPLPLAALLLAALGLPLAWKRLDRERRHFAVGFLLLLALTIWLVTPSSSIIWRTVPLLADTLYPWRMLGAVSWLAAGLLAALAAGLPGARLLRGWRLIWPALGTVVLVTAAVPWLFLPQEPALPDPGLADLARFEAPPLFIGTTTLGEFLPASVHELPDTTVMRAALISDERPDRLEPCAAARPPCPTPDPLDATYQLTLAEPTTFRYRQFLFPGWQATLDGEPWPLLADAAEGVITLDVPAGRHTLRIWWGDTQWRLIGRLISLWALVGMIPLAAFLWPKFTKPRRPLTEPYALLNPGWFALFGALGVGVWLVFVLVDTPLRRDRLSVDGLYGVPAAGEPRLDFAGEVWLLGASAPDRVAADAAFPLDTYWQAQRPIGVAYLFGARVVDARGIVWSKPDPARPADWRFIGNDPWPVDSYRLEPFVLEMLDGTPPGPYRIEVGLVRADTRQEVAVRAVRDIVVTAPANGVAPLEGGMEPLARPPAAHGLRLLGVKLDRTEARPGDPARVGLLWQVDGAALGDFTLTLAASGGDAVWEETQPIAPDYPVAQWVVGDRLRSETLIRLPAGLETGVYTWKVRWGVEPSVSVGRVAVTAPERLTEAPPLDVVGDATLGGVARLLGADVTVEAASIDVLLAWESLVETETSYRVFLHLVDESGHIVAQSDGEPAGWTRPTTGWLPGEVVLDARQLTLASGAGGTLRLVAGLYDPTTGERLLTPSGSDGVLLMDLPLP